MIPPHQLTAGRIARGYALAVLAASLALLAALELNELVGPGAHPEAWSNLPESLATAFTILPLMILLVAIGGMPGLALILAASLALSSWTNWFSITLAGAVMGGLTGLLALAALNAVVDAKPALPELRALIGFAAAGAIGGITFWWAAIWSRPATPPSS